MSAFIIFFVEKRCEGAGLRRNTVIDTALALLFTDVREILEEDETGISNMSYLTGDDRRRFKEDRQTGADFR